MASAEQDFNAAQTGVDPVTGAILSPSERKNRFLRFQRRRISSEKVFGVGKTPPDTGTSVEPQTSAIVRRDSNTIIGLKKEVETLKKSQSENIVAFKNFISSIQENFRVISVNVNDLGGRILGVNNLLQQDSLLEQKKDLQDQQQEKKLAEQGARAGKESLLEQKIQNALLTPIRAVTARTQSIFQRLMQAFTTFFLGWLTNRGIDALKAQASGNTNLLQQIFNNVIGGVTFFFKSLQFINKSLRAIAGLVTGTAKMLGKFLVSGIGALFKGIGKLAGGIIDAGKGLLGIGAKPAAAAAAESAGKIAAKEGAEAAGKGLGKTFIKKIPGVSLLTGIAFGGLRAAQGDFLGAAGEVASGAAATVPGWGTAISLGIDAALLGRDVKRGLDQNERQSNVPQTSTPTKPQSAGSSATVLPQFTAAPTAAELQISLPTSSVEPSQTQAQTQQPTTETTQSPPQVVSTEGTKTTVPGIVPAQIQRVPTPASRVRPEPEQKPNVVMMSSISPSSNQSTTVLQSKKSTAASDVPAIPSSNPDNFYTLYSQVNYNVLI